ncbi:MAG: tetratricopeptide repeat protein [Candidatus Thorarchaeota archaeon]
MKPLGTITMFFPFIDDETRTLLEQTMKKSSKYADFVKRLCDTVCSEPVTQLSHYFAYRHVWNLGEFSLFNRLVEKGIVNDLVRPFLQFAQFRRDQSVEWNEIIQDIVRALKVMRGDWFACDLYLLALNEYESYVMLTEDDTYMKALTDVETTLTENKELECFSPTLYLIRAVQFLQEGNPKEAMALAQQSLDISLKYDDRLTYAFFLPFFSNMVKEQNLQKAMDLLLEVKELSESLGYKRGEAIIAHHLGHIMAARGEINEAIAYQKEHLRIWESVSKVKEETIHALPSFIISMLYNSIGDGDQALKYAGGGLHVDIAEAHQPFALSQLAWAMRNLGKPNRAYEELAIAKKIANSSGNIRVFSWIHLVEALLEKDDGNFLNAIHYLEESLKAGAHIVTIVNLCLLNLTEIEVETYSKDNGDTTGETSGPWMQKLEKHTREKDLPGIAAQTMILKAMLRLKQGCQLEAKQIVEEVLRISESTSMRYLRGLVESSVLKVLIN